MIDLGTQKDYAEYCSTCGTTYVKCAFCGQDCRIDAKWTEEEMKKEAKHNGVDLDTSVIACGNCYKKWRDNEER